jgi:hypothetical protein
MNTNQYAMSTLNKINASVEYAPWVNEAGFRVYIHTANEGVYSTSVSYSVGPGYHTTIGLRYVCTYLKALRTITVAV